MATFLERVANKLNPFGRQLSSFSSSNNDVRSESRNSQILENNVPTIREENVFEIDEFGRSFGYDEIFLKFEEYRKKNGIQPLPLVHAQPLLLPQSSKSDMDDMFSDVSSLMQQKPADNLLEILEDLFIANDSDPKLNENLNPKGQQPTLTQILGFDLYNLMSDVFKKLEAIDQADEQEEEYFEKENLKKEIIYNFRNVFFSETDSSSLLVELVKFSFQKAKVILQMQSYAKESPESNLRRLQNEILETESVRNLILELFLFVELTKSTYKSEGLKACMSSSSAPMPGKMITFLLLKGKNSSSVPVSFQRCLKFDETKANYIETLLSEISDDFKAKINLNEDTNSVSTSRTQSRRNNSFSSTTIRPLLHFRNSNSVDVTSKNMRINYEWLIKSLESFSVPKGHLHLAKIANREISNSSDLEFDGPNNDNELHFDDDNLTFGFIDFSDKYPDIKHVLNFLLMQFELISKFLTQRLVSLRLFEKLNVYFHPTMLQSNGIIGFKDFEDFKNELDNSAKSLSKRNSLQYAHSMSLNSDDNKVMISEHGWIKQAQKLNDSFSKLLHKCMKSLWNQNEAVMKLDSSLKQTTQVAFNDAVKKLSKACFDLNPDKRFSSRIIGLLLDINKAISQRMYALSLDFVDAQFIRDKNEMLKGYSSLNPTPVALFIFIKNPLLLGHDTQEDFFLPYNISDSIFTECRHRLDPNNNEKLFAGTSNNIKESIHGRRRSLTSRRNSIQSLGSNADHTISNPSSTKSNAEIKNKLRPDRLSLEPVKKDAEFNITSKKSPATTTNAQIRGLHRANSLTLSSQTAHVLTKNPLEHSCTADCDLLEDLNSYSIENNKGWGSVKLLSALPYSDLSDNIQQSFNVSNRSEEFGKCQYFMQLCLPNHLRLKMHQVYDEILSQIVRPLDSYTPDKNKDDPILVFEINGGELARCKFVGAKIDPRMMMILAYENGSIISTLNEDLRCNIRRLCQSIFITDASKQTRNI